VTGVRYSVEQEGAAMIGPGEAFTLFFVTLGPERVSAPFWHQTQHLDPAARRGLALRVFVLSLIVLIAGGWVGHALAAKWQVSTPALLIATGVIFFVVALRVVLEQYEPARERETAPLPPHPLAAAMRLTFPGVVTPYGLAAMIAVLAATEDGGRMEMMMIFAIAFTVMAINLLAMLLAHGGKQGVFAMASGLLSAVLAVLQVALAVQIVIVGLQRLGLLKI
jgi:multiple antibiotic resistance protein